MEVENCVYVDASVHQHLPPTDQINQHFTCLHDDAALQDDGPVLGDPAREEIADQVEDEENIRQAVHPEEEAHAVRHVEARVCSTCVGDWMSSRCCSELPGGPINGPRT